MTLPLDGSPEFEQRFWDGLFRGFQHVDQSPAEGFIVLCEQSDGESGLASAAGATDSMDVVFDGEGEGEIDDCFDFGDVETTGGDIGGDEDRDGAGFEGLQTGCALTLREIAMDGGDGDAVVAEVLLDARGFLFVKTEDEDAIGGLVGGGAWLVLAEQLEEAGFFLARVDYFDGLGDARVGAEVAGRIVGADGDLDG